MTMKRGSSVLGPRTIYESLTEFSVRLFKQTAKTESTESNIFMSPYSVSTALALTMLGTGGKTEEELKTGLCVDSLHTSDIHSEYRHLAKTITSKTGSDVNLQTANRIFCEKGMKLRSGYVEKANKIYGSNSQQMDFQQDPEGSRQEINEWAEKQTNGKIKDLIPENQITESTMMVLTNAIYFKGDWKKKFKKERTKSADFHVTPTSKVKVDMMRMKKDEWKVGRSRSYGCKILQLPYKGKKMSMVIFLPDKIDGINKLEQDFSVELIKDIKRKLERQDAIIEIPKFKIESSYKLETSLPEMGIVELFSPGEDFSGMMESQGGGACVSDVFHKAFVEVNEEGTEAAAATAVEMDRCLPPPPLEFIADHPFIFAIIENKHWTVLFLGRFSSP